MEEDIKHICNEIYQGEDWQLMIDFIKENFIHISVIKNKIMSLNLEMEKLQIEYGKEVVFAYKKVNVGRQTMLSEKIKVLQELLEERNK